MGRPSVDEVGKKLEILAAGEVGRFVFCPEAWRLSRGRGAHHGPSTSRHDHERALRGEAEHERWGEAVDVLEAVRLGLRVLFALTVTACLVYRWRIVG